MRRLLKDHNVLFSALAAVLLLVLFFEFIIGSKYLLYLDNGNDTYFQLYAYIRDINHIIHEEHRIPMWSFSHGIGQEIPFNYLCSIFNWPLFLINEKWIPYGLTWIEIIKLFVTGFIFYRFLVLRSIEPSLAISGGILVMLSSYMIVWTTTYGLLSYSGFLFVFWVYSLEKLILKESSYLFAIATAFVLADQPLYLFHFSLFGLFQIATYEVKGAFNKSQLLNIAVSGLAGILLSSMAWFSNLRVILNSTRTSLQFSKFDQYFSLSLFTLPSFEDAKTSFLRFLGVHLEGTGSEYLGYYFFQESPLYFISVFILPLFLYKIYTYFNSQKYTRAFFLVIVLAIPFFPFFRASLWFFSGNYNRTVSLVIAFIMFMEVLVLLNDLQSSKFSLNKRVLGVCFTVVVSSFLYFMLDDLNFYYFKSLVILVLAFLCLLKFKSKKAVYILILISVLDSATESYATLHNRNISTDPINTGFEDGSREMAEWILQNDKGLYRIEKDFNSAKAQKITSVNDAMIQHYKGIRLYSSFNSINYIDYLQHFTGIPFENEESTRWINGFQGNFDIINDLSIKYIISDGSFDWAKVNYVQTFKKGDLTVFRNLRYKPFGRVNNFLIDEGQFANLEKKDKQKIRQNYMTLSPEALGSILKSGNTTRADSTVKSTLFEISSFSNHHIKGNITLNEFSMFYLPMIHHKAWDYKVNGEVIDTYEANFGLTTFPLLPGDNTIEINYHIPYFKVILVNFLLGLLLLWRWKVI